MSDPPLEIPALHIHLPQPQVRTARLRLRALGEADAATIQRLCADRDVASTTLHIPHPYPEGGAIAWIRSHPDGYASGQNAVWGIELPRTGVIGVVGLGLQAAHRRAELGYWIGVPHWGNGYASEAARAIVACAFQQFGVHRVHAHHFSRNPASGAVLRKAGMRHEGSLRGHILKWGVFEDIELYGVVKQEFEAAT